MEQLNDFQISNDKSISNFVITIQSNRPLIFMFISCLIGIILIFKGNSFQISNRILIILFNTIGILMLTPSFFIFFSLYHHLLKPKINFDLIEEEIL